MYFYLVGYELKSEFGFFFVCFGFLFVLEVELR